MNPQDKYANRAKKLLKTLFSGKYGQVFTSPFIMAETGTTVAAKNPSNASEFIQNTNNLFLREKKLAILLRTSKADESAVWELMYKINKNAKSTRDIVSWVDCSNIVLCKKHRIEYIASFDHHFDPYLRRVK